MIYSAVNRFRVAADIMIEKRATEESEETDKVVEKMNDETREVIKEVIKQINELAPYKIVLSGGRGEYRKVVLERKIIKGQRCY